MRFEIVFRGTLWQFVNEVRDLLENIIEDSGDVFFNHRAYEYRYKPGDPMTRVSFRNPDDQDAAKTGSIKATDLPGKKTLLQIWAPDEHWEELKPYWKQLEDVMERHGFIEEQKLVGWTVTAEGADSVEGVVSPPRVIDLTRKKAGRPIDLENIKAYKIVINGGHSKAAYDKAFVFWCKAKNIKEPKARERKNFKQRMKGVENRWSEINQGT